VLPKPALGTFDPLLKGHQHIRKDLLILVEEKP